MNLVSIVLLPFSWMYGVIIWLRNRCYDLKFFSVKHVGVPVISVGNITAGGSGKTPFVELLIGMLSHKGKKVAVISRGYRRTSSGTVIVSDGRTLLESVQNSGDEPYQIAAKFSQAVVIVDEQRFRAAQLAVEKFNVDVVLLDDGFQHRSLHRDLDVVMIDDGRALRHKRLLPAGLMREPLSSLRRAHVLVRSSNTPADADDRRRFTSAPVINVRRAAKALFSVNGNITKRLLDVRGKTCVAFCGIGNPQSFRNILDEIGVQVKDFLKFRDHYSYSVNDIQDIEQRAKKVSAELVITTEKDAVRLKSSLAQSSFLSEHCYVLQIELAVIDGAEVLSDKIDNVIRKVA